MTPPVTTSLMTPKGVNMSEDRKVHPVGENEDTGERKKISHSRLVAIPKTSSEASIPERTPPEMSFTDISNQPTIELNEDSGERKKVSHSRLIAIPKTETSVPERTPPETPFTNVSNPSTKEVNQEADNSSALAQTPPEMPSITSYGQEATLTKLYSPSQRDIVKMQEIQEGCRQLCLPLFYQEHTQVHSLGFTSALAGEGKTFLATVAAQVLANDIGCPITLVECNWQNPSLTKQLGLPPTPGLAEWLCGECSEVSIRHQVSHNLTVVLAGNGKRRALKLLHQMLQKGLRSLQFHPDELFIVDLPSIIDTAYGSLAANIVESLIIVVQAQATPDVMVVETCERLKDRPLCGIILNQTKSQIPSWLRQFL